MSRSTIRNQIYLDSNQQPIGTGTWVGPPINIDEHRRVNITVAIGSSTGASPDAGGFTGTFVVQGTDELANGSFASGAPYFGIRTPGNGPSGGVAWQTIPSGTFAVTNAIQKFYMSFTDVGFAYIRPAFNVTGGNTGAFAPSASGSLGGSGLWNMWLTAKNT
jgi:hypothetical protein